MAWNPSPDVAVAREFGLKKGADKVIILYTLPDGRVGYASWGKTRGLCSAAKALAEKIFSFLGIV